ncbi:hypothetical protein Shewana3_2181 [Shewanella sp. ANA-3]|nr:hypothetical protein Shewana3_2181 [Shewanella sp. ANA-3]
MFEVELEIMGSIKISAIKRLFAMSANECAFPECRSPIIESSGTVTGEIAHIKAANKNGPRYDASQTDDERNSFDNLILLCSRHHTIVDSEIDLYPADLIQKFKSEHAQKSVVGISPLTEFASKMLLDNYNQNVVIHSNSGQVVINSPGAIQAKTVNIKSQKVKAVYPIPEGAVSGVLGMNSYIEYLIGKYKDFQKQDISKQSNYKYMAIYNAMKREFGSKWQLLPASSFELIVVFLQKKIDNSRVGRIRKKSGQKNYHSYSEHLERIGAL